MRYARKILAIKKEMKKKMLHFISFFSQLFSVPFLFVQFDLFAAVSFDPVFNSSENHFHENGLGADPSAENSSEGDRKENDEHHTDDHNEHKNVKILRPEGEPENTEAPLQYIKHQELVSVNFDKGRSDQKCQQEVTNVLAVAIQPASGFSWIHPRAFALLVYGCDTVSELLPFHTK